MNKRKYCNTETLYDSIYYRGNDEPLSKCMFHIPDNFNHKAFVVCRITQFTTSKNGEEKRHENRSYAWYKYTSDFLLLYPEIPPSKKMFFEVIWRDCKECYDIDLDLNDPQKKLIWDKYQEELIPTFLETRRKWLFQSDWETDSHIPCISSSHGPMKKSFHIAFISGSMTPSGFEKIEDMKPFILDFKSYLDQKGLDFGIDYLIYNKNRNMRMLGSRKAFTSRYLVDESGHHLRDHVITLDGFYHKIINNSNNLNDDPEIFINSLIKADCEFDFHSIDDILDEFCDSAFEWKQRDTKKGKMWLLIRKEPSTCPICERDHDKDNQYVFINDGLVLLGCHRWLDEKKKYFAIGRIHPPTRKGLRFFPLKISSQRMIRRERLYPYVQPFVFDYRILIISAFMGKGKTTQLFNYIDPTMRILIITPRRTFSNSMNQELIRRGFNVSHYEEDKNPKDYPCFIVQCESLHKVDCDYDLIVMDECESILMQMTSEDTHKHNLMSNLSRLYSFMVSKSKILLMDAFVSAKTIDFVDSLNEIFVLEDYVSPPEDRIAVEFEKEDDLIHHMKLDLIAGKRIFFFCSLKTKLQNKILKYLEVDRYNNRIYTSDHKVPKNENIRVTWKQSQLVACTSTITVGLNFDEDDVFDSIYMLYDSMYGLPVRNAFQAHMRVRHIREKKLYYHINPTKHNLDLSINVIRSYGSFIERANQKRFPSYDAMKPCMSELVAKNRWEINNSAVVTKHMFKYFLDKCGYKEVQLVKNMEIKFFVEIEDSCIPDIAGFEGNDGDKLSNVPEEEMTKDERGQLLFAQMRNTFDMKKLSEKGLKNEVWEMMWNERKRKKIGNIFMERRVDDGFKGDWKWEIEVNMFSSLQFLQAEAIRDLCFYLEETIFIGYEIPRRWLEDFMNQILPEIERCRKLLGVRDQRKKGKPWNGKRLAKQIHAILECWGFVTFKRIVRTRKRKDGKRKEDSNFMLKFDPIYHCLYSPTYYYSSSSSSDSS
jgi:hypothetical protein